MRDRLKAYLLLFVVVALYFCFFQRPTGKKLSRESEDASAQLPLLGSKEIS